MKNKRSLSIDDNIFFEAKDRAKQLGFNFSAYITYLINKDLREGCEGVKTPITKDNKINSAIDEILG